MMSSGTFRSAGIDQAFQRFNYECAAEPMASAGSCAKRCLSDDVEQPHNKASPGVRRP